MLFGRSFFVAIFCCALAGSASREPAARTPAGRQSSDSKPVAHADIKNPVGTQLGTAEFFDDRGTVKLEIDIVQLVPGTHALHILSKSVCDGPAKFTSSGLHFNPENKKHGFQNPAGPHAGDLCNVEAGPDGHAKSTMLAPLTSLGTGPNSLFREGGTALVIDENSDDYATDPDGKSGAHVACGQIVRN
jgi:superoxide dismutase, Cu-Zn family